METEVDDKVAMPLVPRFDPKTMPMVKLENTVRVGGTAARPVMAPRKELVPRLNSTDVENYIRTVTEFREAIGVAGLNIANDGASLKTKFRKCLGETIRAKWDEALVGHPGATVAAFEATLEAFGDKIMDPNAFSDQQEYMLTAKKRMKDTVQETYDRFTFIVAKSAMLRGSDGNELYPDEEKKKRAFLKLMPNPWIIAHGRSSSDIANDQYTMEQLVRYMKELEGQDRQDRKRQAPDQFRGGQGTGRGRGRVGQGRGYLGRGYSYGGNDGYSYGGDDGYSYGDDNGYPYSGDDGYSYDSGSYHAGYQEGGYHSGSRGGYQGHPGRSFRGGYHGGNQGRSFGGRTFGRGGYGRGGSNRGGFQGRGSFQGRGGFQGRGDNSGRGYQGRGNGGSYGQSPSAYYHAGHGYHGQGSAQNASFSDQYHTDQAAAPHEVNRAHYNESQATEGYNQEADDTHYLDSFDY